MRNLSLPASPAIILDAVRRERSKRAAERSLYEFARQAWHVVEPGVPFVPSWHIETICEHLQAISAGEIRRLLINIPPRHTKSLLAVLWSVWEWLEHPQERFLCASYSAILSTRDNLKARRLIESPWFQDRWRDRFSITGDQNQKTRFENDRTGYRIATSVGGTATGEGGSRLVLDDPHGAQDAQSDPIRESALEWFKTVWMTRLNDPKRDAMVVIMQRLHEADVSGYVLGLGDWEHICIPAEYDGVSRKTSRGAYDPRKTKGELICPERFGPAEIAKLKIALGEYGTSGQLQQSPSPGEGGIIKTKYLRLWPASLPLPQFEFVIQSYDGAYTEDTLNDPTACTVWGVFRHAKKRHVMLLDAWDEYLGYPQLRARVIKDWPAEYGGSKTGVPVKAVRASRVLFENKSSGISLLQDLRSARVPVAAYNPGNQSKVQRAHLASPILEAGMIWAPESTKFAGKPVTWADDFFSQLKKFPNAKHDDYVDTFTQAIIYLKDDGWLELPAVIETDDRPQPKQAVNVYAV